MRDLPRSRVCVRDIEPGCNASKAARRALESAVDETGSAYRARHEDGLAGLRALYPPERVAGVVEGSVFSTLDALLRGQ